MRDTLLIEVLANGLMRIRTSTKGERRFAEILKANRIPYKFKQRIGKYEVDFIVGTRAIEINGHPQNVEKNTYLAKQGYTPLNLSNREVQKLLTKHLKS